MLRVRVRVERLEIASEHLGGCLHDDPKEILTDVAMTTAKKPVYCFSRTFTELSDAVDAEGVNV
jgi:hypothetical protein